MAVDDIYRVVHNQSLYGVALVNVHYYKQTGTTTSGTSEADLAERFDVSVANTGMATNLANDWTSDCIVVREITAGASTATERITGDAGTAGAGEAFPPNAVAVISAYTATFSKSGRGRWYISGMLLDDEEDNCWDAAAFTRIELIRDSFGDALTGGAGGGTFQTGLWSSTPATFKPLVKNEVRSQVRKLRSRTLRRACG